MDPSRPAEPFVTAEACGAASWRARGSPSCTTAWTTPRSSPPRRRRRCSRTRWRTRWAEDEGERTYGEFDMGFFVALLRSLEDELALLEYGDVDGGARERRRVRGRRERSGPTRVRRASVAGRGASGWRLTRPCTRRLAERVAARAPNEDVVLLGGVGRPGRRAADDAEPLSFVCGSMYDRNDLRAAARARRSSSPSPQKLKSSPSNVAAESPPRKSPPRTKANDAVASGFDRHDDDGSYFALSPHIHGRTCAWARWWSSSTDPSAARPVRARSRRLGRMPRRSGRGIRRPRVPRRGAAVRDARRREASEKDAEEEEARVS